MEGLLSLSLRLGMTPGQLRFIDSISDEDLRLLYSACELFVFPSLHEGFGLPILEAMACGAPVIASASSSMPEVIGRGDALFDPTTAQSIAAKMVDVFSAPAFAQSLRDNGALRVRQFTWEKTADAAWRGFESAVARPVGASARSARSERKPRLAYFSPLPPHRSGISDYSSELLPALSEHYDIDVVVDQSQVSDAWVTDRLPIRTVDWFEKHAGAFDRIIYNVGNSPFHEYMLDLTKRWPGVVILHDLYLSSLFRYLGRARDPGQWFRRLFDGHGLPAVRQFPGMDEAGTASQIYPCSLSIVDDAIGVLVHSEHAIGLARELLGPRASSSMRKINFPRHSTVASSPGRGEVRRRLGLEGNTVLVCSFGHLADTKLDHRIVEAWLHAGLADNPAYRLIFVGDAPPDYGQLLREKIGRSSGIEITGHVEQSRYREYLTACDLAVQLRAGSRGETSASAFDCLANGLPLIVNSHGSMAELPDDTVLKIPDTFSPGELAAALSALLSDEERRLQLGARGLEFARAHHDPKQVSLQIHQAVEAFEGCGGRGRLKRLVLEVGDPGGGLTEPDLEEGARAIAANQASLRPRKMLIDVSELAKTDRRTGIERVVRNLVDHLTGSLSSYRPELVTVGRELRFARSFAARHFRLPTIGDDRRVDLAPGDLFLGLDLNAGIAEETLDLLRRRNVTIAFVVYDILPVTHPQYFLPGVQKLFSQWLSSVTLHADALICISRSVAEEVYRWLERTRPRRAFPLNIGVFTLGAELDRPGEGQAATKAEPPVIDVSGAGRTVLMVGTVEPRKGYDQALAAFEKLWSKGSDARLLIVGKGGWMVDRLLERLRSHSENGKRLFWIENASDAALSEFYQSADLLLAASFAEGFGLPLAEAARHRLPILARDIPVFREVAGSAGTFFSGGTGELAVAIERSLSRPRGKDPAKERPMSVTWAESANQLMGAIDKGLWYRVWRPPDGSTG
jgi:glycosyltransferase involved in cell wall biosynthesis